MSIAPEEERAKFSARLIASIQLAEFKVSPTVLARRFNLAAGESSITVHGARKWLTGESIPSQPKLLLLAEVLDVSPGWLRFGNPADMPGQEHSLQQRKIQAIVGDLKLLSDLNLTLARRLVETLLDEQTRASQK